ncbi:pathogenesis-related homeodomain protein-like [Bidens hawaiensis]|uniref:pathogenesis-related homeodomain protein-like n=1 Tax=Bidens hawaiensis TaxID=980011 RepID=UPI00404928FB
MTESGMEEAQNNIGKSMQSTSITRKSCTKRSRKRKSHGNTRTSQISKKKYMDILTNSKNKGLDHFLGNPSLVNYQNQKGDFTSEKRKRGRKRKRTNEKVEVDEAAKLQRRTRYLLIRMKIEQNLLDAYSTEGWKGQSREKIKPERELQRAKKQILKCKLGLRDALRQLDLLSSDGRIDESVIAPDGSVHHDNIHCAKCKLREAYDDNDIILCDGTCNCAFHQMCIDPPLLTENIPPGDQGWFCKYCICKTEIIDSMNAHLGTSYPHDTNWQDVFSVEATLPDDGDTVLNQEEWPSDDSGDDGYDPDRIDNDVSRVFSADKSSDDDNDDANSNYSLLSLDDEVLDDDESCKIIRNTGLESTSGSGSGTDCEFVSGRRQRRSVDYRKLYDEMFGKDALANEQVSEDEDWGPTNRKRREKESDAASTLMALCETEETSVKDTAEVYPADPSLSCNDNKRSFLRIPAEAVEKLRAVFAKNELPSRAVKEDISKQLGLDPEKVNTWFRNARQLSLKTKRAGEDTSNQNDIPSKEFESEPVKNKAVVDFPLENNNDLNMPVNVIHTPVDRRTKKFRRRNNAMSAAVIAKPQNKTGELHLSASTNKVDGGVDLGENNSSLKLIKETTEKEKEKGVVVGGTSEGDDDQQARTAEAQMEKLCLLKTKLEKLQKVIQLRIPNRKGAKTTALSIDLSHTIFVPVAHLKEKP